MPIPSNRKSDVRTRSHRGHNVFIVLSVLNGALLYVTTAEAFDKMPLPNILFKCREFFVGNCIRFHNEI